MMAPSLAGSPRVNGHRDYVIKVLLKGMTGPLGEGPASAADIMLPMGSNTDAWVASIASYVRSSFGNAGGLVTPADVARVRAATAEPEESLDAEGARAHPAASTRIAGRLEADGEPQPTKPRQSRSAHEPWTSGAPQAPGMWFQIELPQPVMLTEIEFDSPARLPVAAGGAGRGAAGGRRAGAAPAPPALPFPRGYRVEVSLDGRRMGQAGRRRQGRGAHTAITFAPARAKFVRITQTDTVENAPNWAIANLRVYEAGAGK